MTRHMAVRVVCGGAALSATPRQTPHLANSVRRSGRQNVLERKAGHQALHLGRAGAGARRAGRQVVAAAVRVVVVGGMRGQSHGLLASSYSFSAVGGIGCGLCEMGE